MAKEISKYSEIAVYEAAQLYGETGRFRFLQFGEDAVQGAVDLRRPERIVLEYPRAIMALMEHGSPAFRDVFIIGHGIGTLAAHYPEKRFVTAELDDKVVELSRAFFGYAGDNVIVGDGRKVLEQQVSGSLDYIVLDAFTKEGTPPHLTTLEFFAAVREKLRPRGAVILNLMGRPAGDKRIGPVYTTLREVFPYARAFYLPDRDAAEASGLRNILLVGSGCGIETPGSRNMAGFVELEIEPGYILRDRRPRGQAEDTGI
ncbi:spermidine synthase [Paenibacillus mucilaginosus]|uniref:Spermine synthase n=2 Tax=Paenibacillus mucilaginosus TaxID=61624 RepID=H6NCV7_9BACL|nr:fused MFS/spermidine synthase [Paenibacillus mucilaginosus]AEI40847.1 Spermine synthase [Paenibacillus mucilaginosus KNP414]AFC29439.1 Spermine synthase [Paenibacillus mucilaginosus 3016]MCG7211686.1 fused MFS/spermidine synthase [Paenibacillus mucilaginosus]WDM29957.1 fused MFS/spermidine synthase [Paenibacillus mucilaginosus]WFA18150.1 spermidine synthase [Paenibacillus mucilaginosus]